VSVLRNNGWLLIGAVAALSVAWLRLGSGVGATLRALVPLPWGAIGLGLLVFAAFAGLHFRLQLVRALEQQRDQLERNAAASRLIRAASADGRRWLRVVQENLELVDADEQADEHKSLYLDGARAHADKLEQAFERIEGNQRKLDQLDAADRT
jgi:hypothetical protein